MSKPRAYCPELNERDIYRFMRHCKSHNDCLMWIGRRNEKGYGEFYVDGRTWKAHRIAFLIEHGFLPEGFQISHTCANVWCVNPNHLTASKTFENITEMYARKYGGLYLSGDNIRHLKAVINQMHKAGGKAKTYADAIEKALPACWKKLKSTHQYPS
jgi:hypothetical protein